MPVEIDAEEARLLREMLTALRDARAELRKRALGIDADSHAAQVIASIRRAIRQATAGVEREMLAALEKSGGRCAEFGIEAAVEELPAQEAKVEFALDRHLLREAAVQQAEAVTGMTQTLRAQLARASRITVLAGGSVQELADKIANAGVKPVGPFATAESRAAAIAVTETNAIYNRAAYSRYEDAAGRIDGLEKEWVTSRDGRVRDTHAALSGRRIPFADRFDVGGVLARGPHDPELPAREAVRCRCRLVAKVPAQKRAD